MTRALIRKIHVGCRQLGLDQDARHEMQLAVTGNTSLKDMDEAELNAVLEHLQASGFKLHSKGGKKRPQAPRADLRLVHVLWAKLGDAGALKQPGRAGLNAFVRTRFGTTWGSVPADIDMLRDHQKINAVIQSLKSWGERVGIDFDWSGHRT